jgi:hypothetical protein
MDMNLYSIRCESCGKQAAAALPLRIFAWIHQAARFVRRHKDCGDPQRAQRYDAKKRLEMLAMTLPPHDRDELLERIAGMGQAKAGEAAAHVSSTLGTAAIATPVVVHGEGQFAEARA